MKKRKKPIFLVSALVLLAAVVVGLNSSVLNASAKPPAEQAATDPSDTPADGGAGVAKPEPAPAPQGAFVSPDAMVSAEEADPGMKVQSVDAVDPGQAKISAPKMIQRKPKSEDRASALAHSGWYMRDAKSKGK